MNDLYPALISIGVSMILSFCATYFWLVRKTDNQIQRNDYIDKQIELLQKQIDALNSQKIEEHLARLEARFDHLDAVITDLKDELKYLRNK